MKSLIILIALISISIAAKAQTANPDPPAKIKHPLPKPARAVTMAEANSALSSDVAAVQTGELYKRSHVFIYNTEGIQAQFNITDGNKTITTYSIGPSKPLDIQVTADPMSFSIKSSDNTVFTLQLGAGKYYNIVFYDHHWQLQED